ncbi:hypothetical protein SISSUDRAFT_1133640 [Sistotremastrum suecicum HHB10207 ss-3]|uniref:CCHC-type domain-containing protein n=1 Tax=Sistotremastrum suecicum HHB10207 ss-3 TaxID=1314776 RepID=A0A165WG88_9AGAM|nr:hypothetical protein SISSUDRAFT_1133640 [Sistotremastrum suecicum HHB10207 ss-3]
MTMVWSLWSGSSQVTVFERSSNPSARSSTNKPAASNRNPTLSAEEKARRRASGACFTCGQIGHESRNCADRKKAPAPSPITSHSITIPVDDLDSLAKAADATARDLEDSGDITLYSMLFPVPDPNDDDILISENEDTQPDEGADPDFVDRYESTGFWRRRQQMTAVDLAMCIHIENSMMSFWDPRYSRFEKHDRFRRFECQTSDTPGEYHCKDFEFEDICYIFTPDDHDLSMETLTRVIKTAFSTFMSYTKFADFHVQSPANHDYVQDITAIPKKEIRRFLYCHFEWINFSNRYRFEDQPLSQSYPRFFVGEEDHLGRTKVADLWRGRIYFVFRMSIPYDIEDHHIMALIRGERWSTTISIDYGEDFRTNVPAEDLRPEWANHSIPMHLVSDCEIFTQFYLPEWISLFSARVLTPSNGVSSKSKGKKRVAAPTEPAVPVERNAMTPTGKDADKRLPKPVIIETRIDSNPVRTLIDSGSMADFMSTTLADQLKVKRITLATPLPLQLAVKGSRSKINVVAAVRFQYQEIDCEKTFYIVNLEHYDLILGTPFLWQHSALAPVPTCEGSIQLSFQYLGGY